MPESYTPEPVVQFAPGYVGPFTTVPSSAWVDISAYAAFTDPDRGRSSELDVFSASTCTFTLEADDRRFDPLNTDGPYFGQLVPNTPFRVLARMPGPVDHDVWYGYADAFQHRPTTFTSTVRVPCTDAFKPLARKRLPDSVYEADLLDDSPDLWWRFSEAAAGAADISPSKFDGASFGGLVGGSAGGTVRPFSDGSIQFAATELQGVLASVTPTASSAAGSIEMWVMRGAASDLGFRKMAFLRSGTLSLEIQIAPQGDGYGGAFYAEIGANSPGAPLTLMVFSPFDVFDGQPHHVVCTWTGVTSAGMQVYRDGVPVFGPTSTGSDTVPSIPDQFVVGNNSNLDNPSFDGSISDFILWDSVLSPETVASHYELAVRPWAGDTTGQRIGRVLDLIGWPADLRAIDTGEVFVGHADLAAARCLDYLQLVARTEQGRLFVAADGKVTFHARSRTINGTSAYTFAEGDQAVLLDAGIDLSLDDSFLYDEAIVQRKYGVAQRALAAGVTEPTATLELGGLLSVSDAAARALAERLVWRYGAAKTRLEGWTVQPELAPGDWATILDLEIGDVVTVELTPALEGDPITVKQFIERISPSITADDWTIEFHGSPVDDTVYFRWGTGSGTGHGWGEGKWR